jgi:hypothetical protein
VIHEPGSLHARLNGSAQHAWRLYCALELEIPHRQSTSSGQERITQHRRSTTPIPWNSVAAELTLEFHTEIRRLESHLKERLTGGYPKRRGSSSTNTRYAIDSVVKLCTTSDTVTVLGVLSYIATWTRRADTVFNPQNGLHRLPRQPGEGEARCPYCKRDTMRWNPPTGQAVCVNPYCKTDDGQRPRWAVQFTLIDDQLAFRWDEMEAAA